MIGGAILMITPCDTDGAAGRPELDQPGLRICFRAEPMAVRAALVTVENWLCDEGIGKNDLGNAQIVLGEVLNNITEHAYENRRGGLVELSLEHHPDALCLHLKDHGRALPDSLRPDQNGKALCPDPAELREGGFGWFLIRHLSSEIQYFRDGSANRLHLRLPLG